MPFKFFTVPIHDSGQAEAEMNGFLRSHKVLSVDRRWVEQGSSSFWSFCVDYLESGSGGDGRSVGQRGKVDYKEVLSAEDFAVFGRLREVRKEIAAAEAVPVYTIFTNEQLAQMVKVTAADHAALDGIHRGPPGPGSMRERSGCLFFQPHRLRRIDARSTARRAVSQVVPSVAAML